MCNKNDETDILKNKLIDVIITYGESILRHPKDEKDFENFDKILMDIVVPDNSNLISLYGEISNEQFMRMTKFKNIVDDVVKYYHNK